MIILGSPRKFSDGIEPQTLLFVCMLALSGRLCAALAHQMQSEVGMHRRLSLAGDIPITARKLRQKLEELQARLPLPRDNMGRRVDQIGVKLQLSAVEVTVLDFLARASATPMLAAVSNLFRERLVTGSEVERCAASISVATGLAEKALREALRENGALRQSGLIDECLDPATFVMRAVSSERDTDEVFEGLFGLAAAPELTLADFPHAGDVAHLMVELLRGALHMRARGIHVLIHGPPGVGKSELSRVIAREACTTLFEIGTPKEGEEGVRTRTDAYGVAQRYLREVPNAVIRFDEVEDAFIPSAPMMFGDRRDMLGSRMRFMADRRIDSKAFTNQWLENAPVPTIWVGNAIGHIDAAFLRRFQLTLVLDSPPPEVRTRILARHLGGLEVAAEVVDKLARDQRITPAHVETAARAARMCAETSKSGPAELFVKVLKSSLGDDPHEERPAEHAIPYELQFVRADADLPALVAGLKRTQAGRILLSGAPGTGKTALATHIADVVGKSLIVARASELLNKYLGETEKMIAELFGRAKRQNAVLLIDEADSLLFPRAEAFRRWEVSQTNELLMQIERFEGLLLCATNDTGGLDEAAFRRFDFKVRLSPPDAAQRWRLLEALLSSAAIPLPVEPESSRLRTALGELAALVPGDFAAVRRKIRLAAQPPLPAEVVSMLAAEHSWKPGAGKQVAGFGRGRL